jgi:hypothetical protein
MSLIISQCIKIKSKKSAANDLASAFYGAEDVKLYTFNSIDIIATDSCFDANLMLLIDHHSDSLIALHPDDVYGVIAANTKYTPMIDDDAMRLSDNDNLNNFELSLNDDNSNRADSSKIPDDYRPVYVNVVSDDDHYLVRSCGCCLKYPKEVWFFDIKMLYDLPDAVDAATVLVSILNTAINFYEPNWVDVVHDIRAAEKAKKSK